MIFRWFERAPRVLFILMALTVFGLVVAGALLQKSDPLFIVPCHMCVFQRYLYVIIGVLALIAAYFAKPNSKSIPFFSFLILAVSAVGVYTAGTQTLMQLNPPPGEVCKGGGDDFYSFIVDGSPLKEWLPALFRGEGDCYEPGWTLLHLSIANWSLIAFSCCVLAMILMFFKGGKSRRSGKYSSLR